MKGGPDIKKVGEHLMTKKNKDKRIG